MAGCDVSRGRRGDAAVSEAERTGEIVTVSSLVT